MLPASSLLFVTAKIAVVMLPFLPLLMLYSLACIQGESSRVLCNIPVCSGAVLDRDPLCVGSVSLLQHHHLFHGLLLHRRRCIAQCCTTCKVWRSLEVFPTVARTQLLSLARNKTLPVAAANVHSFKIVLSMLLFKLFP